MPKLPQMSVRLTKSIALLHRTKDRLRKVQDLHDRLEDAIIRELDSGEQVNAFSTVYGVYHEFADQPRASVLCQVRSRRLYWRHDVRSRIKHML